MIHMLQSKWAAVTAGLLTYALTTALTLHPGKQLAKVAQSIQAKRAAAKVIKDVPSWSFHNPELDQLMVEVKTERETLRVRASQLDELQARLEAERQEICVVTQTVYRLRAELDSTMTRVTQEESANLKKLAKVYATMTPEGSSRIFREMDDDQVVKILALMKESESAPIIEIMSQGGKGDAKRAAAISNRLRLTLLDPPASAKAQ
jgi:flagellar motility protein MotE (MotC chaperone)